MISLFAGGEIENPRFKSPLSGDPGMQVESLEERSLFSGGFTAAVKMQHVEQPTQVYEFPLHLSVPQSTAKASVDTAPKSMDPGKSLHVELTPSDDNGVLTGIYTAQPLGGMSHPMQEAISNQGAQALNRIDWESFAGRPPSTKKGTIPNTTKRTVLLIEDDPTSRTALATLLRRRGWNVALAGTMSEGLRQLMDQPDNVIVDLMLPDGEGERVVQEIREANLQSRVTVMTGVSDPDRLSRLHDLHPESVLTKPVNLAALLRSISQPN